MNGEQGTTKVQRAFKLHEVPEEKWPAMVRRTITGAVFIGFGIAAAALWAMPWYVSAGAVLIGATTWSTQMVTGALKALVNPIRAFRRMKDEPTDG